MKHQPTFPLGFKCPYLKPEEVAALTEEHPCYCKSVQARNLCQISVMMDNVNRYYTSQNHPEVGANPNNDLLAENFTGNDKTIIQGNDDFQKRHKLAPDATELIVPPLKVESAA